MLVGLDIGSSSAKAIVLDGRGRVRCLDRRRFGTTRAGSGRVEHDPEAIHQAALAVLRRAAGTLGPSGARLGIATQRSTVLIWDRDSGRALTPAWSWQDVRSAALCRRLARRDRSLAADIADRTGLRLSPHYSAPKLALMLQGDPGLRRAIASGRALWGPLATFLLWRLTGGALYALDHANAQRTLLMRIDDLAWDLDLAQRLGLAALLDAPALPALVPTRMACGAEIRIVGRRLVLGASSGDQQAALEGLRCRRAGDVAINYGSGAFVLTRVGGEAARVEGLLTSIADSRHVTDGAGGGSGGGAGCVASYAVEGTVNAAATALEWVERRFRLRIPTARLDRFLGPGPGRRPRTLHFLPALSGLGAPRWEASATPRFFGATRGAEGRDFLAAALESIAQRCAEIVRAARRSPGTRTAVRVSGGLTRSRRLLQFQADLLQQPVVVGSSPDATAIGAAIQAAEGQVTTGRRDAGVTVAPRIGPASAAALWRAWERAVYGPGRAGGAR